MAAPAHGSRTSAGAAAGAGTDSNSAAVYTPQFLGGRAEILFLYSPIAVTLALFLISTLFDSSVMGSSFFNFAVAIFLFDTSHTVCSWGMLSLPEMKQWRQEVQASSRFFYLRWVAVAVSILVFFILSYGSGDWSEAMRLPSSLFIFAVLPAHHTIFQMKGLSLNYDIIWMKHAKVEFDLAKFELSRKLEHAAIWLVLISTVIMAMRFRAWDVMPFVDVIPWVSGAGFTMAAALFARALLLLPPGLRGRKALFLTRVLTLPLACFYMWAVIASRAIHGIEYMFVTRKMISNSTATAEEKRYTWKVTASLFGLVTTISALMFLIPLPDALTGSRWSLLVVLSFLLSTNTYTHYWFDSIMWSMKNPVNRRWVAPLLARNSFVSVTSGSKSEVVTPAK